MRAVLAGVLVAILIVAWPVYVKVNGAFGKNLKPAGIKLAKKAFEGNLGLRGRSLSGMSLIAQQNR